MPVEGLQELRHPRRNVRLGTLVRLRWLAVLGQTVAVLLVYFGLDFPLPIVECLITIAVSAWLNLTLPARFGVAQRLEPMRAAWLLAFDIAQPGVLLFLTGGLQNPFSFLLLGPVLISATALPARLTLALGAFAMVCATALAFTPYPLPWGGDEAFFIPDLYKTGDWLAMLLAIAFIGAYAWRIADETRRLGDALAATELVLAREQHLSQLDGLAAAAAHELGTPLSTIAVIARELERAEGADPRFADDVRLLREQAQRCREILAKITQLSASMGPFDRMPISGLIDEVISPHRDFGIAIDVALPDDRAAEPTVRRNPGVLYGLGNLVENAVDFARSRVEVAARWSDQQVVVTVADDGPGFSPEIIHRIGEPYVTSRGAKAGTGDAEPTGLGLGFFIAKTLLERSGATLALANRTSPETGAVIRLSWARLEFEHGLDIGAPALETVPSAP